MNVFQSTHDDNLFLTIIASTLAPFSWPSCRSPRSVGHQNPQTFCVLIMPAFVCVCGGGGEKKTAVDLYTAPLVVFVPPLLS